MNVLSLFDGISTAQQAFKNMGVKVDSYYASEIDKYAIAITQKNFPNTIQLGSVVGLKVNFQPDLMILGSPCQDLSIAKKDRKGLDGERSGLFWEAIRIHKEVKPKYFVYENVSSMKKEWKEQMLKAIQEIDPNAYMIEINASLVSAQNRKRVFFTNIPNITQPEDRGILLKDILQSDAEVDEKYNISLQMQNTFAKPSGKDGTFLSMKPRELNGKAVTLNARYFKMGRGDNYLQRVGQIGKGGQGDRIYSTEGKSVNLSANGGGRGAKTGLYAVASRTFPRNKQEGVERKKQIEIRKDKKSNALTSVQGDSMVMNDYKIRKLTCVECERLQSLPDNFTEKGINEKGEEITISNTQRYKALGNGFNCAVIEHILSFMPI